MKTKYEGLWPGRTAWYISKPFTKQQVKDMPNKFRLIIRENKYHKNNSDGTPRFIFAFADAETAKETALFQFEDEESEDERTYTYSEVVTVMRGACRDGQRGIDEYDCCVEDYI